MPGALFASRSIRLDEPRNIPARRPERHIKHIVMTTRPCSKVVSRRGFVMTSLMLRLSSVLGKKGRMACPLPRVDPASPSSSGALEANCNSEVYSSSVAE